MRSRLRSLCAESGQALLLVLGVVAVLLASTMILTAFGQATSEIQRLVIARAISGMRVE